jgi:hypothetical protein
VITVDGHGGVSFRSVLGEYALNMAAELDVRATRDS